VAHRVEFLSSAARAFGKLTSDVQRRLRPHIDALAENPRPPGAKALQGTERGYLRIRVGDYRVVYRVEDDRLLVVVVRISHRKEVYRG
jgi:mRNA interferase RelE/StbE